MTKFTIKSKCTSVAAHFEGLADEQSDTDDIA
jgi:hypothetical protein